MRLLGIFGVAHTSKAPDVVLCHETHALQEVPWLCLELQTQVRERVYFILVGLAEKPLRRGLAYFPESGIFMVFVENTVYYRAAEYGVAYSLGP